MKNTTNRTYLSPAAAARELGVGTETIRRYVASGELRAMRLGKRGNIRIDADDLIDLLQPVTVPDDK